MQLALEIAKLELKSRDELQALWREYFKNDCNVQSREFYIASIAHRMQELAYGGLSTPKKEMIAQIGVGIKKKSPPSGTRIIREYKGVNLRADSIPRLVRFGADSPWTKNPSKADLTLNLYARQLAIEHLADNEECFVYLLACIGRSELPSAVVKTIKAGIETTTSIEINKTPSEIIALLGLKQPVFAKLCRIGLIWLFTCFILYNKLQ